MIAKLWNERDYCWELFDNVYKVQKLTNRFKVGVELEQGEELKLVVDADMLTVEEVPKQNPPPKDWKPRYACLQRMLVPVIQQKDWDRTFNVAHFFIHQPDGTEKVLSYGFIVGYLLNGDGKTIETL